MPAQMRTHPYVHCRMFADTGWHKTHTFTMLISYRHAVFICKFTELHTVKAHLLHTLTINVLYIHVGTHKRMLFTGGHPPAVQPTVSLPTPTQHMHTHALSLSHTHTHTRGGDGSMSHWSGAQSFWQQHKVSQQVTAGCLSAREGVTSHRETTSLICHFRSVSQRKCRREGETDMERKTDRERVRALKYITLWFGLMKPQSDRLKDVGLVDGWFCHHYVWVCVCVPAILSQLINNLLVI